MAAEILLREVAEGGGGGGKEGAEGEGKEGAKGEGKEGARRDGEGEAKVGRAEATVAAMTPQGWAGVREEAGRPAPWCSAHFQASRSTAERH